MQEQPNFIRLQDLKQFHCSEVQDAQNAPAFVRLQEYSLADFVAKIQDLVQQGYVFDFKSNDSYPVQIGNMFAAGLFKVDTTVVRGVEVVSEVQEVKEDVVEGKPTVRRGRK